ncbi:hypothetical protein PG984_003363 [Apiospora sp. TS-2023a]
MTAAPPIYDQDAKLHVPMTGAPYPGATPTTEPQIDQLNNADGLSDPHVLVPLGGLHGRGNTAAAVAERGGVQVRRIVGVEGP